jgi:large subunit ribosomal protein L10
MAKTKGEKKQIVENYVEKINGSDALFIITPTKITPNEANDLRKKLAEKGASFNVVKNTLFRLALKKTGKDLGDIDLSSENAIIFCEKDASENAKILYEFLKEIKKGAIKGGFLDGTLLGQSNVEELAKLPSKDVMLATTVRTIAAPITNFVYALNGNILNLINVINNISEKSSS